MDMRWDEQLSQVSAPLNYLRRSDSRPVTYTYEPPPGVPWRSGELEPHVVGVRDARPVIGHLSLDHRGFAFTRWPSAVRDFYDTDEVRAVYLREAEELVRAATGAKRVLAFDFNVRNASRAAAGSNGAKEPVKRVHNDFTAISGPRRARDELLARGEDPAAALAGHYAIINVWRPIGAPVEESPLAVCDASTIADADLLATDLVYRDRVGETYSIAHNPAHRWFYFPKMHPDEALFIKCFDSAEDGRPRFTAHSAFDDPTSPPDARPRESIEVRTLAFLANGTSF